MMVKKKEDICIEDKYRDKAIRFLDKGDHYELIFTDEFNYPTSGGEASFDSKANTTLTDVLCDMKDADKNKELHIFVSSFGGMVVGLNLILQQVQEFKYRVGINTGTACSCGFMLLTYCHEIYTSPYAQFMYHCMSGLTYGKIAEQKHAAEYNEAWWKLICDNSFINEILTPEELERGQTTEVFLTGQQLIDRDSAMPYSYYLQRTAICPDTSRFFVVGNEYYHRNNDGTFSRLVVERPNKKNEGNVFTYSDLLEKQIRFNITSLSQN